MRLLALLLAVLTLIVPVSVGAADGDEPVSTGEGSGLQEKSDDLVFISYQNYLIKYLDVADESEVEEALEKMRAREGDEFSFPATEYVEENTTAEVEVLEHNGRECISIGEEGDVTWKFDCPKEGFYTLSFNYCSDSLRNASVEKVFYINGKVPFQETRYLALSKLWEFQYPEGYEFASGLDAREGAFSKDAAGNEIRTKNAANTLVWQTYTMHDRDGYIVGPFEYYLKEGENTITLEGVGDSCFIDEFTFGPIKQEITYEEYLNRNSGAKDAEGVDPIYINAEVPAATSDYTIYAISDHSSAITEPQDATLTVLNTIGSDKWTNNGQWIRYEFTVEKSGFYTICPRWKQSLNEGVFSSRSIKIDGEVPFVEAESVRFGYDNEWRLSPLCDDDGTEFRFYLEAGKHTLQMEACLGDIGEILQQSKYIRDSLTADLLAFTKLTGQSPDANRSYGFMRIMPDTVADLSYQSQNLKIIMSNINQTSGIKSDATGTLEKMIEKLRVMGSDETKIAGNLSELQNQIMTFGEWIANMTSQPLEMDYILIQPADAELPRASANFFQSFAYEVKKFFASFFADYDSVGSDEDGGYVGSLTAWTTSGREQAQITNNIIKNGFTSETNVAVTLKLVAANTLIPAIIAGTAPDVSIDATSPLDLALRGAAVRLNDFDTFDEVMARFPDSASVMLSLYGDVYAIPTQLGVPVMFYRSDILADLGLSIPETWDDLMSMVPVLQFNNMDIGVSFEFPTFLFQNDAEYWKDDGMRIAFDEKNTLDAFETLVEYFTKYSLPVQFNGINRMRNNEMPIFLGTYMNYNYLVVSAPEISGLWGFTEVPGVERIDENGNKYVDHTAAATSSGIIMPKTAKDRELTWDFMDWYTSKDPQVQYCNDMVALLGSSAKQAVANIEAFESLPWSSKERETLVHAFENSKEIEVYPGDYIIARYYNFAFNAAYNEGADPSDALSESVPAINAELTRKRREFGYMVAEEWDAVKEYTGLDSYYDTTDGKKSWLEYAEQNGIDDYKEWMSDHGITEENYVEWSKLVKRGETTQSYKDWIDT
jgi:ABC-type glycerol-3-phosphate transport system substrate-binding protein